MPREKRLDFGRLDGAQRTPQGGLRVPAALTRVGVLQYSDPSGRSWKELRPAEEVFHADSLATLRGATVVDLHPEEGEVTPANFKALSVGHVHDDVRRDGELAVATLTVNDAAEVELVEAGKRVEVSCGYECDVDPTPGDHQGERYDGVQRRIRYNHVGLGPEGWGRAGREVSLRLDGVAVEVRTAAGVARSDGNVKLKPLMVRGRTMKLDSDEDVAAAQGAVDEEQKKADEAGALQATLDAITGQLTEAITQVATLKGQLAAAEAAKATPPAVTEEAVPEAVADAIARKRVAFWGNARDVLGPDAKLDGRSREEIAKEVAAKKRSVVEARFPAVKLDGLSADTIDGMYRAATAGAAPQASRNDALGEAHRAAVGGAEQRSDGEDPAAEGRKKTDERWKKPTTITAQRQGA